MINTVSLGRPAFKGVYDLDQKKLEESEDVLFCLKALKVSDPHWVDYKNRPNDDFVIGTRSKGIEHKTYPYPEVPLREGVLRFWTPDGSPFDWILSATELTSHNALRRIGDYKPEHNNETTVTK